MTLDSNSNTLAAVKLTSSIIDAVNQRLSVMVSSHQTLESADREKFTTFQVQIKLGDSSWTVNKRYSEFYSLYNDIKKIDPDNPLKMPSKWVINLGSDNIKKRMKGLDEFIRSAIGLQTVLKMPALYKFLQITQQHLNGLVNQKTSDQPASNDPTVPKAFNRTPLNQQQKREQLQMACSPDIENNSVYASGSGSGSGSGEEDFNLGASNNPVAKPSDFEFLSLIGKGSFGKVFMANHKFENKIYAIKILKKETIIKRNEQKHIMAERNVLIRNVQHPFLVGLHYSFQSADKLYFVLDYVNGGELFFHLSQNRVLPEHRVKFYSAEIAHAIGYLHSMDIIYRDLKPENILIDREGHIKLTDFGLCKEGISAGVTTTTYCGTPEYLAPEILNKKPYTRAVDWWCFGSVVYEMLFGFPPFYSKDVNEMYNRIVHAPLRFMAHQPNVIVSNAAKSMLEGLLQKNDQNRLGSTQRDFAELQEQDFFNDISWSDLLAKRLPVPWLPKIESASDITNIDPEFTGEQLPESLGHSVIMSSRMNNGGSSVQNGFRGFTYEPDSILNN